MYQIRKKPWQRLLSMVLSVYLLAGILPAKTVNAAQTSYVDEPGNYDIQMLDRLAGNQSTIIVTNHSKEQIIAFTPMVKGEKTALIYAMPANGPSQISIYRLPDDSPFPYEKVKWSETFSIPKTQAELNALKESDAYMGHLIGFYSLKHCEIRSEGGTTYVVPAEGKETIAAGKKELYEMSKQADTPYARLNHFPAIGMDGKGSLWRTLREYYEQKSGTQALSAFSLLPEEEPLYQETSLPDSNAPAETTETVSEGNEEGTVSTGDENSINESVSTGDVSENSLPAVSENEAEEEVSEPVTETIPEEPTPEPVKEEEPVLEETGDISDGWELICPPEEELTLEGIDASQIPEDYYVTRDYLEAFSKTQRRTTFAARSTASETAVSTPLYNYVCWNGRYWDEKAPGSGIRPSTIPEEIWNTLSPEEKEEITRQGEKVLPEGKYLLVIEYVAGSPLATFQNTRFLPVEVVDNVGGTGNPTDAQVLATLEIKYGIFAQPGTGYPTLTDVAWGDPVNLLSGSLSFAYTDLQIEGAYPLAFTRSYESCYAGQNESGLGYGWSHNYAYRLETMGNIAMVTLPEGGRILYRKEMNGEYEPAIPGNSYHLFRTGEGFLLQNENGSEIIFDGNGNAQTIKAADGNITELSYQDGRLNTIQNKDNRLTLTWNGGFLQSITDNTGRTVTYTYDADNLTQVKNTDGDDLIYTYDESHNMLTMQDFNQTLLLTNTYDENHRVTTQEIAGQEKTTFTYDETNRTNTFRSENGLYSVICYDEQGRIQSEENNDGVSSYTYDDRNRKTEETDKNGNTTRYEYVGESTLIAGVTYADNTKESYTYDENGRILSYTDRLGATTTYAYNEAGCMTQVTDAEGGT